MLPRITPFAAILKPITGVTICAEAFSEAATAGRAACRRPPGARPDAGAAIDDDDDKDAVNWVGEGYAQAERKAKARCKRDQVVPGESARFQRG